MKVVILSNKEGQSGGASLAAERLLDALVEADVDVAMVVKEKHSSHPHIYGAVKGILQKLQSVFLEYAERIPFYYKAKSKSNRYNFSTGRKGIDILSHPKVQEADIIHLHWINKSYVSIDAIKKLESKGKKLVWTFHDMWAFTGGCHYSSDCKKYESQCTQCPIIKGGGSDLAMEIWLEKKSLYSTVPIFGVSCSRWLMNISKTSSLWKNQKARAIPNPIDTTFYFPLSTEELRSSMALPKNKKVILFLARNIHEKRKGLDLLLKSMDWLASNNKSIIDNTVLLLGGSFKEDQELNSAIEVKKLGFISSKEEIRKLFSVSDLFILPSREDNLPNTVVESMSCGTPVVAFGVGGVPEMVEHGKTGYLAEPENIIQLAQGIAQFLELSDQDQQSMSYYAREFALSKYSPEAVAREYLKVYHEVLEN